jgi:thiol-activated cytolysin
MASRQVDIYIRGLNYNPDIVLSKVPEGQQPSTPIQTRNNTNGGVVICTTRDIKLGANMDELAILSKPGAPIYPGQLIHADQNLVEGKPTPITLPRAPMTLVFDLPGLDNPGGKVQPDDAAEVQGFINRMLDQWNRVPASQGYQNSARSIYRVTKAYSMEQVALDLGINAKWTSGNASMQLGVQSSTEKSVVVAYYKQVYYTISMGLPRRPGEVFSDDVELPDVQQAFDEQHPPAYIASVDYGRTLMIKMETSAVSTAVDLKAAFEQATSGGVTAGGNLKAKYDNIVKNASFSVVAFGGGAETPIQLFSGATDGQLQGLAEYIKKDAVYRRDNPGLPISYTVNFLKDSAPATIGSTTSYTERECTRYDDGYVRLVHAGGYVARFNVTWKEPTGADNNKVDKSYSSGDTTAGWSYTLNLPGDAEEVRIKAEADTGVVWNPRGEIMNVLVGGPSNKTYRATGTTLNRSWDNG